MQDRCVIGLLAIAGGLLAAVPGFAADASSSACQTIAQAKYQQWKQPRLLIARSKTLADGTVANDVMIVTENTAYRKYRSGWTSAGITLWERDVRSPDLILGAMKLASCTRGASVEEAGQPATRYDLTYLPDASGYSAHGTIWISDMTGLPLREDMQDPAPPANALVATSMSATYRYNADVEVPRGAEVADSNRLNNNQAVVRNMQSGSAGGLGGPAQ